MNRGPRRVLMPLKVVLLTAACVWFAVPAAHMSAPVTPSFTRIAIDGPFIYAPPWGKAFGDIDGDGYMDIAGGFGGEERHIYWYQSPTWTKYLLGTHDGGEDIQLIDVNNDGWLDVVTATGDDLDGVAWYENPKGKGGDPRNLWTRHVIEAPVSWYCGHDVVAGDVNGDGKVDVVVRVEDGPTYVYLQSASVTWTKIRVTTAPNGQGIQLLDVNRDGRVDLVENGFWLEQPAGPVNGTWLRHDFAAYADDAGVMIGDINNDGRPDVILCPEEHGEDRIS